MKVVKSKQKILEINIFKIQFLLKFYLSKMEKKRAFNKYSLLTLLLNLVLITHLNH